MSEGVQEHRWSVAVWLLPALLLLVAVMELPYGYYQFLRVFVFLAATALAIRQFMLTASVDFVLVGFLAVAALFNPIFSVWLDREVWMVLDVATACFFIACLVLDRRSRRT